MPAGPLLAGVVEQPLADVLPDGLGSGQPDGVGLLDFDGAAAAAAGDPQQVSLDVGQTLRSDRRSGWSRAGIGARVIPEWPASIPAASRRRAQGVPAGGMFPRTAAVFASFSICFGVGIRQLAGRSVIPQSEHNKNTRVESAESRKLKKSCLVDGVPDVGTKVAVRLESQPPRLGVLRPWPPARTGKAFCAFRSSPVPSPCTRPPRNPEVSFNQLNRKTGHRIKYAKVDADTGEEVPNEDIVKGYKVDNETFVEVTKEELEKVALESTRTIEIDEFVDRSEIDPRYLIRLYYLPPDGKIGDDAFAVIRETT